jgi:hypothetical protein
MSKRAIVEKDLVDFFKKNDTMKIKDWNTDYRKLDELSNSAGPLQRLMLQAIYIEGMPVIVNQNKYLGVMILPAHPHRIPHTAPYVYKGTFGPLVPRPNV